MTQYEKTLKHSEMVVQRMRANDARRIADRRTRNKTFLLFTDWGVFEKGFDTLEEVDDFRRERAAALWELSRSDFEILGYFPPCDVKSLEEAEKRVGEFYRVEKREEENGGR